MLNTKKFLSQLTEQGFFDLIKKEWIPDLIDNNVANKYAPIDWYSPSTNYWMEAKCRTEEFPTLFIQQDKYELLKQKDKGIYINSTPAGIFLFYIYEMEDFEPVWYQRYMKKSTFFKDNEPVKKWVADIPMKYAINIDHLLFK